MLDALPERESGDSVQLCRDNVRMSGIITTGNEKEMRMKRKITAGLLGFTMLMMYSTGCRSTEVGNMKNNTPPVSAVRGSGESGIQITLEDDTIVSDSSQVDISGDTVRITEAGTYVLTGGLTDGRIVVETGKEEDVELVLNGVDITCRSHAPIQILQAGNVTIDLADNSVNLLSDGADYEPAGEEDNTDAAIFSKDDLKLKGNGVLSVSGNYKHGIVCKDDLTIKGGTYYIQSVEDGINANDSITIDDGTFFITAGDDGMHVDEVLTVNGGTITILESYEGLEGHQVVIHDGRINITASDDGINANCGADTESGTEMQPEHAEEGEKPAGNGMPDDRLEPEDRKEEPLEIPEEGVWNRGRGMSELPQNGNRNAEDGIPSFGSGADRGSQPEPGYENPEREQGELPQNGNENNRAAEGGAGSEFQENERPVPPDAGGMGPELPGDGMPAGGMDTDADSLLQINGGTVTVNAGGDGLDSNGILEVNGGMIYVSGAASGGDAAIDYGISGVITGGTILAAGYSNMAQSFSDTSAQHSVLFRMKELQEGGSTIVLKDGNGKELLSWQPPKEYDSVLVSTPDMKEDGTYTLSVDGVPVETGNK